MLKFSEDVYAAGGFRVQLSYYFFICDALRDLVTIVQCKNRVKHPWRSVNFSKVPGFSPKSYKTFHIVEFQNDLDLRLHAGVIINKSIPF